MWTLAVSMVPVETTGTILLVMQMAVAAPVATADLWAQTLAVATSE